MIAFDSGITIPSSDLRMPAMCRRPVPPPLPHPVSHEADRMAAAMFALLGCLVFAMAAALSPYDNNGRPLTHGTHRQLGLPPCSLKLLTGFPCPSCGMTTSISLFMHGDLAAAWRVNWAGVVVAFLGLASTAWLFAIASGLFRHSGSIDDVIKWLALAGGITALVRWSALVATHPGSWMS